MVVATPAATIPAIMDSAGRLSTVISMGVSADIDFGEALDFLIQDPQTDSILLYIEGIKNARTFMSGLRAAAPAWSEACTSAICSPPPPY
jgi:acetyltransferase